MRWTDELRIETPEQIEVDLELAGLGSRFLAQMTDWFWKVVATLVLMLVSLITAALLGHDQLLDHPPLAVIAVGVAGVYILWLGYGIYFEVRWNGQTPGKRSAGIRVIREGGAPLDARTAAVRNLLAVADFLPVFHMLGAVLILLTERRQRLGDMAAGTLVVRERVPETIPDPTADPTVYAASDIAFTPSQLNALTAADRGILRSFLLRYDEMDPGSRDRLARRMAEKYGTRTGHPEANGQFNGPDALVFLASLLRDLEEKLRRD